MATYPGGIPSLGTKTDSVDDVMAADYNTPAAEIEAICTELGADVAGSVSDLVTRLAVSLADDGTLEFADSTVLTISSGAITVTQNWHRVATEGGAGTDDLDTINGLTNDGAVIFLRASTSNDIVVKHGTGNLSCVTGGDITLGDTDQWIIAIYDDNLDVWLVGRLAAGDEITTSAGAANNYVAVYSSATNIEGTDDLQWDGTTFTVGDGTADRDYVLTFNGETNDGVLTWMEDEDYLKAGDGILMNAAEEIFFRDTAISIKSGDDGHLDLTADVSIDLNTAADTDLVLNFAGTTASGVLTWMEDEAQFVFNSTVVCGSSLYNALVVGSGAADIDYAITFDGETSDGTIRYHEDELMFDISRMLSIATGGTKNAKMTVGITIQQGSYDDEAFAIKSSDVAHGMTDIAETDTYFDILKVAGATGGAYLRGFGEATAALYLYGNAVTDDTTKTTAGVAPVTVAAYKKSGTTIGAVGTDANLMVIRNDGNTRFIFDAEGSAHADVEWTTFDEHDDVQLLTALEASLGNDALKAEFGDFLTQHKETLQANKLVTYGEDGHNFINTTRMHMLEVGAIRQLARRVEELEAQLANR